MYIIFNHFESNKIIKFQWDHRKQIMSMWGNTAKNQRNTDEILLVLNSVRKMKKKWAGAIIKRLWEKKDTIQRSIMWLMNDVKFIPLNLGHRKVDT